MPTNRHELNITDPIDRIQQIITDLGINMSDLENTDLPPSERIQVWTSALEEFSSLAPVLEGVRNTLLLGMIQDGGSLADISKAMGVGRSTAQYRVAVARCAE